jgi:hypothetical protein
MGEFTRLIVRRGEDAVQLDMARDWRKWPPVQLEVGPVIHVEDAVSSKVTALVGRRAPRDFIDVAAAIDHSYSRGELMRLAFTRDSGLRVVDFTYAVRQLDQLTVEDFSEYGLDGETLDELRLRFADWPRHEADDYEGHAVQAAVAEEERSAKKAEPQKSTATLAGRAYPIGRTRPDAGQAPPTRQPPPAGESSSWQAPEGRHPRRFP